MTCTCRPSSPSRGSSMAALEQMQCGGVTLSATGSDNMELASIAFQVDGTSLTPFATTAPYTMTWNATGLSGTHTIVAIAYDCAGNCVLFPLANPRPRKRATWTSTRMNRSTKPGSPTG
ncbi:Ig-like domain-containing protein [Corallococcus terminator]|uniref:Ig-like domain-containing protein n=1 Tax=Corallococcus terminator TaxID=2316733 RepID=UPI00244A2073|nr:Ig-like domain-containing protein [Corallococcus terminator]